MRKAHCLLLHTGLLEIRPRSHGLQELDSAHCAIIGIVGTPMGIHEIIILYWQVTSHYFFLLPLPFDELAISSTGAGS